MANPFKFIGRIFKSVAVFVSDVFVAMFGRDVAEDFAASALKIMKSSFGKVALTIVTTLASSNLTNEEKRNAAFEQIKVEALATGIVVKDSIIFLLVELAVNAIKNNFGPVEN
jgi:hypothetical protein